MPAEPKLYEDIYWVWEFYALLSRSRPYLTSGIPMRIAASEILALCTLLKRRNEDDIDLLLNAVAALDEVFIEDATEKRKKAEARREVEKGRKTNART